MTDQEIQNYLTLKIAPQNEREELIGRIMAKWVRDKMQEEIDVLETFKNIALAHAHKHKAYSALNTLNPQALLRDMQQLIELE